MVWTCRWAVCALLLGGLVGCGGSGADAPTASVAGDAAAKTVTVAAKTPAEAVQSFLEAVRLGNDDVAGKMLTKLAQQKTAEMEMVVSPPGSDTATFSLGKVELVGGDGAQVDSTWTDLDQDGDKRTDHITWILRLENGEWRIAGMATKIFQDQDPVVLNFENPQEMIDKQQAAEEEAMRRANDQSQEARKPEDPFQTPARN